MTEIVKNAIHYLISDDALTKKLELVFGNGTIEKCWIGYDAFTITQQEELEFTKKSLRLLLRKVQLLNNQYINLNWIECLTDTCCLYIQFQSGKLMRFAAENERLVIVPIDPNTIHEFS